MEPDDLPDDDPDIVAGMKRLAELRELELEIPEIGYGTLTPPS